MFGSLSAVWKGALAALGAVLLVFGIWKGYGAFDGWLARRRAGHIVAAEAQGDSATAAGKEAALIDSTQVIPARTNFRTLIATPEVRRNPVAVKVAEAGTKLTTSQDKELAAKAAQVQHLEQQVRELQDAGPPPEPRAIPYAKALYTFSTARRPLPDIRAGVDYRLVKHVYANVEGAYQPPPAPAPGEKTASPEFRASIGVRITF
jgi:hypothetical protein